MKPIRLPSIIFLSALWLLFGSCAGMSRVPEASRESVPASGIRPVQPVPPPAITEPLPASAEAEPSVLDLTFAGDIMAHTVNFSMKEYARIYDGVRPLLASDGLSFGNLETPVADALPLATYPRFNVHSAYLRAAVEGGFDVFSLANNHSNDQGTKGIAATRAALAALPPGIYSSGLKARAEDIHVPVLIEKNGWKILFLSVTEILNSYDAAGKLVHHIAPSEASRAAFLAELERMRRENPCDIFVLSIHLNESEYVRKAGESKKRWFRQIAASGVDVVWGHHPHVMQEWETAQIPPMPDDAGTPLAGQALFMYSMGNFVSGQREKPALGDPKGTREYTGDAVLLKVRLSRNAGSKRAKMSVEAVPVTNYTDPVHGIVVRLFDDAFIEELPPTLRTYFRKRDELMRAYLPLLPTTPVRDILVP